MTEDKQVHATDNKYRIITISSLLFLICIIGLYIAPYFINIDNYKQLLIDKINAATGKQITIDGNISLSINPLLDNVRFTAQGITVTDIVDGVNITALTAKEMHLNIALHRFITNNKNIDAIEFNEAIINPDNTQNGLEHQTLRKLLNNSLSSLSSVSFVNSSIFYRVTNYTQLNLEVDFNKNGKIEISGTALDDNDHVKIQTNIGSYTDKRDRGLELNISKAENSFELKGSVNNSDNQFKLTGSVTTKVIKPTLFIKEFSVIFPSLSGIFKNKLDSQINMNYDIEYIDENINLKNIKIASPELNGAGEINFSLSKSVNLNVELTFDNIDLTSFLAIKQPSNIDTDTESTSEDYITSAMQEDIINYIDFTFMEDSIAKISLNIKEANASNFHIKDFLLSFDTNNGIINKGELSFTTDNKQFNNSIKIANITFSKSGDTNFFLADLTASGNNIDSILKAFQLQDHLTINDDKLNYTIDSKIILSPTEISSFDINGQIGDQGQFSGSIATQQKALTDYNIDLKFDHLKLMNFDLPLLKTRIYALLNKSDEDDYLTYFRWFRTLSASYNIKVEFDNTEFKNEQIRKFLTSCSLEPGSMSLTGSVDSDFASGDYSLLLTAQAVKPKIDIKVNADNLNFNRFSSLLLNFLTETSSNFAKQEPAQESSASIWSDKKLNLFKIQKYSATMDFAFKNLQMETQSFNNVKLTAHTSNDIFYIDNIYLGVYGGELQARGNISFFDPTLYQFSFTGSNLETKDLVANLLPNFNTITGPVAITGSIITKGNDPKDFVANLSTSFSFSSSQLNLNGMDLDQIVEIALMRKTFAKDQALSDVDQALNSGSSDITSINGNISSKNGIFTTKNTSFRSRFTGAAFAMLLDLNNMTMSSNTEFLFMPKANANTINYRVLQTGTLPNGLKKTIDDTDLLNFVMQQYDIAKPVTATPKAQTTSPIDNSMPFDQDTRNYIYQKLEQSQGK